MKKKIFTLSLCIFITLSAFSWTLAFPDGMLLVEGAEYRADACGGYSSMDGLPFANSTNPFSFYQCDVNHLITNVRNCPKGLAFDPINTCCDYPSVVMPSYPQFPWGDYLN